MNLRRALLSATVAVALLSACSLRPRYRDVVVPEGPAQQRAVEGQTVVLRLVEPKTGQPIPGARVLATSGRARLAATTDAQGELTVPVSKSLLDDNPLVEVVLPRGVKGYRFEPVVNEPAPQPPTETDPSGEPRPGSGEPTPEAPAPEAPTPVPEGGTDAGE